MLNTDCDVSGISYVRQYNVLVEQVVCYSVCYKVVIILDISDDNHFMFYDHLWDLSNMFLWRSRLFCLHRDLF